MRSPLVYVTVLVIATCGLVYELVAGTLASYVLGDSVTQFSTVIGVYLSALGVGSYLSKYVQRALARRFVEIELGVALVGGASAPLLFLSFAYLPGFFRPVLYGIVLLVGTLVGLEIPLDPAHPARVRRLQGAGGQGADLRLPGRARRVAAVPDPARAPPRARPHVAAVRAAQRRGRPLVGLAVPPAARERARPEGERRRGHPHPHRGVRLRRSDDRAVGGRPLRRHRGLRPHLALPAHRDHAHRPRPVPALPERQPAVLVGGRVPLPRGARAPRLCAGPGRAPRARPRRRRRPRRARDPQAPGGERDRARRPRPGDDAAGGGEPAAAPAQPGVAGRIRRCGWSTRTRSSGSGSRRSTSSTSSSSTSPIPTTSRWASCTRGISTRGCAPASTPRASWPCRARRRSWRASRSGASTTRWRRRASMSARTTRWCRRSASGASPSAPSPPRPCRGP